MARRRRDAGVDLNFDGLTDSVTNLVGALILLVVLLIGITKEVTGTAAPPPPAGRQPSQAIEGTKTADALLRQLEQLRLQVSATDQQIGSAQTRVEELGLKVDALVERAGGTGR